ncbi:MAG: M20/M25/M40 family metallo-hydrolase [Deltaproteobacteria bacterium]|nr:M20/M25/M40 family metallo-hydrolase [Deltaproteobacteria bacterium]
MEEILKITRQLIGYKTMQSHPGEIARCADFIGEYMNRHAIPYGRVDYEGIPSIAACGTKGRVPVLLMSHLDVVDGPDELFEPREEEGRLYGRGSLDDKYAVALSMVLMREHLDAIRRSGGDPEDPSIGILITGDEEVGGHRGAERALERVRTDFCIALDGGGLNKIVIKEKGILRLKLIARGKTAHGARPWLGENAIENLIRDYGIMREFFLDSTPEHWHRTMNFSVVRAGKALNQVPDYAEALFDIRYTEQDDLDYLLEKIGERIGGELLVEAREPLFEGGDSPYLDLLLETAKGTSVGFEHGASDARFLSDHGIPGIVWGADGDHSAHSDREHVEIDSIRRLHGILKEFMERIPSPALSV